jgi:microcystin-dependent protein
VSNSTDTITKLGRLPVDGSNLLAPGTVAYFSMNTAPSGWLKANGDLASRTTYAALFAAIGTTYGAGDGSTTFALPDLRGEFVRALDDGKGVDSGRGLGTAQGSQAASLRDFETRFSGSAAANTGPTDVTDDGVNSSWRQTGEETGNTVEIRMRKWDRETRPRNIALLACIKA